MINEDVYIVPGFIVQKQGNFRKTYYYIPELQKWVLFSRFTKTLKLVGLTPSQWYNKYIANLPLEYVGSCPICGKPLAFISPIYGYAETCGNRHCACKFTKNKPENLVKQSAISKALWQDELYRTKTIDGVKRGTNKPEVRQKRSEHQKRRLQQYNYFAESNKVRWQKYPDKREKYAKKMSVIQRKRLANWTDEQWAEYGANMRAAQLKRYEHGNTQFEPTKYEYKPTKFTKARGNYIQGQIMTQYCINADNEPLVYKSKLELTCIQYLEQLQIEYKYEPISIKYRKPTGRIGYYIPDFVVYYRNLVLIIEVKCWGDRFNDFVLAKEQAAIQFVKEQSMIYDIYVFCMQRELQSIYAFKEFLDNIVDGIINKNI